MIRRWMAAGWGTRVLALGCLYVIVDSLSSIGSVYFAKVLDGDPLDRFTVVRAVPRDQQAAVAYSYLHSNSSAQLTAIHLHDREVPAAGTVIYRNPGGRQVLVTNVAPAQVGLRWTASGRPHVTLPANVIRESDWNQRGKCFFKGRAFYACWDSTQIDVE